MPFRPGGRAAAVTGGAAEAGAETDASDTCMAEARAEAASRPARRRRPVRALRRSTAAVIGDFDAALTVMGRVGAETGDLWNNRATVRCLAGEGDGSVVDQAQAFHARRVQSGAARRGLGRTGCGPADGIRSPALEDAPRAWTSAGCPDAPVTHFL